MQDQIESCFYSKIRDRRAKMRLTIIDEVGLRTKDGKGLIRDLNVQQIEIPDEVLAEIKNKFELWLKEKQNEHRSS